MNTALEAFFDEIRKVEAEVRDLEYLLGQVEKIDQISIHHKKTREDYDPQSGWTVDDAFCVTLIPEEKNQHKQDKVYSWGFSGMKTLYMKYVQDKLAQANQKRNALLEKRARLEARLQEILQEEGIPNG